MSAEGSRIARASSGRGDLSPAAERAGPARPAGPAGGGQRLDAGRCSVMKSRGAAGAAGGAVGRVTAAAREPLLVHEEPAAGVGVAGIRRGNGAVTVAAPRRESVGRERDETDVDPLAADRLPAMDGDDDLRTGFER